MKKNLLILLLAGLLCPLSADELIKNGDFSDGTTHWSGHFTKDSDTGSSLDGDITLPAPSAKPGTQGIRLRLNPNDWTEISQEIECPTRNMTVQFVYSVSDVISFSTDPEVYKKNINRSPASGLSR